MLDGDLTTIALCWRIERRDGVTLGLTDHDRDLAIGGLVYRAAPGMTPSAIKRSATLDADTMDAGGVLTSDAISAADLAAGRFDGARVALFATDWTAPEATIPLGEGTIGAVEVKDGAFTAELRGAGPSLAHSATELTSPSCRAELGDRRCRVAMAGRRRHVRVVSADGSRLTTDRDEPAENAYGEGLARWLTGANSGLERAIAASRAREIILRADPHFPATPGDLIELTEGCDKTVRTCAARFGNAANFRGEPFLPGIDLLTRYPGA